MADRLVLNWQQLLCIMHGRWELLMCPAWRHMAFCREDETLTLHVLQVWLPATKGGLSHIQAGCDPAVEGCSFACTPQ